MSLKSRTKASVVYKDGLNFSISTNNETIVRAVLILAEGVFQSGETLARHPPNSNLHSIIHVTLRPPRDVPIDVHIKALVGYTDSEQFHIFEITKQLPKFAMYTYTYSKGVQLRPESYVQFQITERIQRICIWINQNFLLKNEDLLELEKSEDSLCVNMLCLRDKLRLSMDFKADGQVTIATKDMRTAGDIVQSLAIFLNLSDLQSTANFPEIEEELRTQMELVSQIGEDRVRLSADTAERAQLVTALLPAAQDATNYDLKEMLNRYKEIILLNEELLTGCHIRRAIQEKAVSSLKKLHTILQHAAKLRVGKYNKTAVAASRKAVRENNVEALVKVLRLGDA